MGKVIIKYVLVLLSMLPLIAMAETLYVQSKAAKIYSEKSFKSSSLGEFKRGQQLEMISKEGSWIKVRTGKLEGWMPTLLLSDQKPVRKDSVLLEKSKDIKETARRRASSTSVAGAARGLQGEEGSDEVGEADYDALEKVESIKHSEDEIKSFMNEGVKKGD